MIGSSDGPDRRRAIVGACALSVAAATLRAGAAEADDRPVVATRSGSVRGVRVRGVSSFLGIPYAAAPVGARRWRPPADAEPWTDVREGGVYPNRSYQPGLPPPLNSDRIPGAQSEDCLYINIHTLGSKRRRKPVLVWIHGGGFVQGSANDFDLTSFARRHDVVVAAMNYRLGMFGFLNLAQFGPDYAGSAAIGFQDQIKALEWVRDNIAAFGGDPGNVTIIGGSAGGGSVLALMAAPKAQGLFHKASAISPGEIALAPLDVITPLAAYAKADPETYFARLRDMTGPQLLDLQKGAGIGAMACVEGIIVPQTAPAAIRARGASVPFLAGCAGQEGAFLSPLFATGPKVMNAVVTAISPVVGGGDGARYLAFLDKLLPGATPRQRMDRMWFDYFRAASLRTADAVSAVGGRSYVYIFDVPTARPWGPTHGSDVSFAFNLMSPDGADSAFYDRNDPKVRRLNDLWTDAFARFVKTGDPGGGRLRWPNYDQRTRDCLVLRDQPEVVRDPDGDAKAAYGIA